MIGDPIRPLIEDARVSPMVSAGIGVGVVIERFEDVLDPIRCQFMLDGRAALRAVLGYVGFPTLRPFRVVVAIVCVGRVRIARG